MLYDNDDGPIYSNLQSKVSCNGDQTSCYYDLDVASNENSDRYYYWQDSQCPLGCDCVPNYTLPDTNSFESLYPEWTGDTGLDGVPRVYGNCGNR
jgi:hypothetical protein